MVRDTAPMVDPRPHTRSFPEQARRTLGLAIVRAREAVGYPKRPAFAATAGISVRSLLKVESGDPVGASVYEAVARVLPGWDEDTPRRILEGGPVPRVESGAPPDTPTLGGRGTTIDEELAIIKLLQRRGWPDDEIDRALDSLGRVPPESPPAEQRSGTDR
jgi:hypothetical protein